MKENLQENEVILHVDYSESYNNTQQDEIQRVYFGNSTQHIYSLRLHTQQWKRVIQTFCCCCWQIQWPFENCNSHLHRYGVKRNWKETEVKKLIVCSDRYASQFGSRFVFKLLSSYRPEVLLEWNFDEAHHGKGPMEGIGGTIRKVVVRQIKSRKVVINSPIVFCEAANKFVPSIKYLYQPESSLL